MVRTFVRPLDRFPSNFEVRAAKNGKGVISPQKNERMLLNNLLGGSSFHRMFPRILMLSTISYYTQSGPRRHRRA